MSAVKRIMIVGGSDALVRGTFARRFQRYGIEIGWHVSDRDPPRPFTGIPQGCDAVVFISTALNHSLRDRADAAARKAQVKIATVDGFWTSAEPVLRMQGVLPSLAGKVPAPDDTKIMDAAVAYIVTTRGEGRVPKHDEVEAAIQRAFGQTAKLTPDRFREALSRAARELSMLNTATAEAPVPATEKSSEIDIGIKDIHDWARVLIEEDPNVLLNMDALVASIASAFNTTQTVAAIPTHAATAELRAEWSGRTNTAKTRRGAAIRTWLDAWIKRARATGTDFPAFDLARVRAKKIFGVMFQWELMREARVRVYGHWAYDLIGYTKAAEYLSTKRRGANVDVRNLLQTGAILSVRVSSARRETSKTAIDEYLARTAPAPAPSPSPEPAAPTLIAVPPPAAAADRDITTLAAMVSDDICRRIADMLTPLTSRLDALNARIQALEERSNTPDIRDLVDRAQSIEVRFQIPNPKGE